MNKCERFFKKQVDKYSFLTVSEQMQKGDLVLGEYVIAGFTKHLVKCIKVKDLDSSVPKIVEFDVYALYYDVCMKPFSYKGKKYIKEVKKFPYADRMYFDAYEDLDVSYVVILKILGCILFNFCLLGFCMFLVSRL